MIKKKRVFNSIFYFPTMSWRVFISGIFPASPLPLFSFLVLLSSASDELALELRQVDPQASCTLRALAGSERSPLPQQLLLSTFNSLLQLSQFLV